MRTEGQTRFVRSFEIACVVVGDITLAHAHAHAHTQTEKMREIKRKRERERCGGGVEREGGVRCN